MTLTVTRAPSAPTLRIDSPRAGTSVAAPASVVVDATAVDPSASITRVRFFANGTLLGEDTTSPYRANLTGVAAGNYVLTAQASGVSGVIAAASAVPILVTASIPAPPLPPKPDPSVPTTGVQLSSPQNGAVFLNQGTIPMAATVSDPNSTIAKVEFYRGSSHIGTASSKPYAAKWTFVSSGTYVLTARAYQRNGVITTSAPITVRVTSPPAVRLTSPLAGTYATPATLILTAGATDLDGTIARVEFYQGTTLLGQSTTAPYTHTWQGVGQGTYLLTAKAYDNLGVAATSSAVSVTLNVPPTVVLISPRPAASFPNQSTVTLEATAADPGGSIRKVEFYRANSLVGVASSSPYRINWTYVGTGSYVLRAKAYDDKGLASWSSPVTITVTKQQR